MDPQQWLQGYKYLMVDSCRELVWMSGRIRSLTRLPAFKTSGCSAKLSIKTIQDLTLGKKILLHTYKPRLGKCLTAFYGPMIYTVPYVMLLMRANPLRGQVGGGWALDIEPCEMASSRQASAIWGPKKSIIIFARAKEKFELKI
jgi:hypothetical protein